GHDRGHGARSGWATRPNWSPASTSCGCGRASGRAIRSGWRRSPRTAAWSRASGSSPRAIPPVRSGCRSGWTTRSTAWNSAPGWTGPSTWSSPVWRWCARPNAPDPEGSGAAFRSEVRPRRAVAGVRDGSGVGGLGRGRGGRRGRGLGRLGRVGGRPARIALRLALGIGLWLLRPALAAIGEVALAVAVLLEVGLVPAATGEAERRRGQGALHRGGA